MTTITSYIPDLVPVTTRHGKTIMVNRELARSMEQDWQAIDILTKKLMMQQECFDNQNKEIEEINTRVRKINNQSEPVIVTIARGIDGMINHIRVIFFFFKEKLVFAACLLKSLPTICASNWQDSRDNTKNNIKMIACLAIIIAVGVYIC